MQIIPRLKPELLTIVHQIAAHLAQQRARARDEIEGGEYMCRYRDKDGNMCAVGCLIPDAVYRRDAEGGIDHAFSLYADALHGGIHPEEEDALTPGRRALVKYLVSLAPTTEHRALRSFLGQLQRYHDDGSPDQYQWLVDHHRDATDDELRVLILHGMDTQLAYQADEFGEEWFA